MNVLSLFDGMSCGQIALERAGIKVDNYFASEIDKYAIQVTKHNYPNTKHIGDVTKVRGADLPSIDILFGGSPCQGFSSAGKQLNFDDPRSKLFFEFVRLLEETKPRYFLLENVQMKSEYQDIITGHLGVNPIVINSNLVSAQNRKRSYWTNIPQVTQPQDRGLLLKDIIEDGFVQSGIHKDTLLFMPVHKHHSKCGLVCLGGLMRSTPDNRKLLQSDFRQGNKVYSSKGKSITITAIGGGIGGQTGLYEIEGVIRKLTRLECERLQTVPDCYTSIVSNTQAIKMLGNGWTVDVIAHIFKCWLGTIND